MGSAVESLTRLVDDDGCYDIAPKDLLSRQIEAADEFFQERVGQIKLLARRAEDTGVAKVGRLEDIVPLLFAHTSYKSYPEAWFVEGKWDRMGQWLNTLMPTAAPKCDPSAIAGLDGWIEYMEQNGYFLACSSGTTGKCSILPSVKEDLDFVRRQMLQAMIWGMRLQPARQFHAFALTPLPNTARIVESTRDIKAAFFNAFTPFPGEPITPGQVSSMVMLRRSISDGTAKPGEIAAFEELSKARAKGLEDAMASTVDAIVAARAEPIYLMGQPGTGWQIAQRVREMGFGPDDFHPDNGLSLAGGTKGAVLPPDGRQQIFDTFNVRPERTYQFYGMQDITTVMPSCIAGRYHVAPWVMMLILDENGENLIDPPAGEFEGRAAFLDLSMHGRWGGVITGDKVNANFGRCACGHQGPTIGQEIVRYADMPGGDKITCAGTLDAYVRGIA